MTFRELCMLVRADLYRYHGRTNLRIFAKQLLMGVGFKYSFWMRVTAWLSHRSFWWAPVYLIARLALRSCMFKFGIEIPYDTQIGPGFYIGHFGGITVSWKARIGRNCNISQGVTIGQSYRGARAGAPTIGNGVYLGPGAKLFGDIKVGDNAAVGANCVVTRDVPENAVVVGVPGRVISYEGSAGYVNKTDYETACAETSA